MQFSCKEAKTSINTEIIVDIQNNSNNKKQNTPNQKESFNSFSNTTRTESININGAPIQFGTNDNKTQSHPQNDNTNEHNNQLSQNEPSSPEFYYEHKQSNDLYEQDANLFSPKNEQTQSKTKIFTVSNTIILDDEVQNNSCLYINDYEDCDLFNNETIKINAAGLEGGFRNSRDGYCFFGLNKYNVSTYITYIKHFLNNRIIIQSSQIIFLIITNLL